MGPVGKFTASLFKSFFLKKKKQCNIPRIELTSFRVEFEIR